MHRAADMYTCTVLQYPVCTCTCTHNYAHASLELHVHVHVYMCTSGVDTCLGRYDTCRYKIHTLLPPVPLLILHGYMYVFVVWPFLHLTPQIARRRGRRPWCPSSGRVECSAGACCSWWDLRSDCRLLVLAVCQNWPSDRTPSCEKKKHRK
jgi:hypothetical protein